ncbi:NUDIX domain-containing protein [Fimbriiglobus ruber]|uniref:Nudix hydrolase family protein n=1 Tax=Fimbriiglobus ruber TaxID=1908690 RepID=A0A225DFR2_9BACT|nr:NUDIX domain-containing protein [Fimbriiglobus ruber]OWK38484.1 Nudix hydrolase family protein [Fimbriiglobus ruber]
MYPRDLFRYCPRCGAATSGSVGASPFECAACGLTFFFNPAVAAGAFLFDEAGRALFLRRAHEPAKGKLAIPGGFIDFNETAEDGLRREVLEETGLEIADLVFIGSSLNNYLYRDVTYPVVDLIFTARALDPAAARPLDGVAALDWRRVADVDPDELAFNSIRMGWEKLRGTM